MASNGAWTCGQVPRAFVCLSKYLEDFLQVLATVDEAFGHWYLTRQSDDSLL